MGFGNGTKSTFSMCGLSAYPLSLLHCPQEHLFVGFLYKTPKEQRKKKEMSLYKHTDLNRNTHSLSLQQSSACTWIFWVNNLLLIVIRFPDIIFVFVLIAVFLPAPIVYGKLFDSLCLARKHSCTGKAACSLFLVFY